MTHDPNCSGPSNCRYCRAILNETPEEMRARLTAEDTARGLRTAAGRASLRTAIPPQVVRKTKSEWADHFGRMLGVGSVQIGDAPDPYRGAADAAPLVLTAFDDPAYDGFGTPPDGYAIALAVRQAQQAQTDERAERAASTARPERAYVTNGVPDGYAMAIHKLKEQGR